MGACTGGGGEQLVSVCVYSAHALVRQSGDGRTRACTHRPRECSPRLHARPPDIGFPASAQTWASHAAPSLPEPTFSLPYPPPHTHTRAHILWPPPTTPTRHLFNAGLYLSPLTATIVARPAVGALFLHAPTADIYVVDVPVTGHHPQSIFTVLQDVVPGLPGEASAAPLPCPCVLSKLAHPSGVSRLLCTLASHSPEPALFCCGQTSWFASTRSLVMWWCQVRSNMRWLVSVSFSE
jgi:hypothetical protein